MAANNHFIFGHNSPPLENIFMFCIRHYKFFLTEYKLTKCANMDTLQHMSILRDSDKYSVKFYTLHEKLPIDPELASLVIRMRQLRLKVSTKIEHLETDDKFLLFIAGKN